MNISLVGEALISLGCLWAALSWLVPSYLLKPPPDDPDGEPRLTMPPITPGLIAILVLAVLAFAIAGRVLIEY